MRRAGFAKTFILVALAIPCMSRWALAGDEPAGWKKAEAGEYLDERAKAWFAFSSAGRGEGETKSTCVSCHTAAPYALARPVLRKLTGAGQPTEYETRFLAQTKMRVENWEELDSSKFRLMYDSDGTKMTESWGTEAVINAVILAFDDRYEGRGSPSESTRQAFANLWRVQASEGADRGSWDWLNFKYEPWESDGARYFGATLAAIAVGSAPGYYAPGSDAEIDKKVALLRGYLKDRRAGQNAYNRAWLLWAASGLDGLLTPDERKSISGELLEMQQADGGWRLASLGNFVRVDKTPQATISDGYATGFVLHALQTAGIPKSDPKIAKGLNWLRANQSPSGEWTGISLNKERDPATHVGRLMSDAATAYAILALSH